MRYTTIIVMISFLFPFLGDTKDPIRTIGDIGQIASPIYGLYLTYENHDSNGRLEFFKSTITTSITTHLLKIMISKTRPDSTNDNSFPSGHTSAAFSGATFIHKRYGLKKALPAYIISSFVGFSRVDSKKHYWEDVIGGIIIAGINSWIFTSPFINNTNAIIQTNQFDLQINLQFP